MLAPSFEPPPPAARAPVVRPLTPRAGVPSAPARATARGPTAGPPLLLIEPVPAEAADTRTALETGSYVVVQVADGDAALRVVRATLMRCVVSELYIPCSEGRCVIAALRGDRTRLPRLRVLAYTRHHTPEDRTWALDAGADGVLAKPASAAVLLREVRRLDALDPPAPTLAAGAAR